MWVALPLIVGSLLLVVCGFIWVARRDTMELAKRIAGLDAVPLDEIALHNMNAVRARVGKVPAIDDPVTDEPTVFYELRVERVDQNETLLHQREAGVVTLADGHGRAELMLAGAEIAGVELKELETSERVPSPKMARLLERFEVGVPSEKNGARYALMHRAIRIGTDLTVVGIPRVREKDGQKGLPRFTPSAGPLYVTPDTLPSLQERETGDLKAMNVMLGVGAGLGVAAMVVGLALML